MSEYALIFHADSGECLLVNLTCRKGGLRRGYVVARTGDEYRAEDVLRALVAYVPEEESDDRP